MWRYNMYINVHLQSMERPLSWWPDDSCAGAMPERMFKIIYSSPYASHETATSSHIVKCWYLITYPSILKHNVYINVHLQSWNVAGRSIEFSTKMALFKLFCLLTTHTACPPIQTIAGYAPARSIAYPSYVRKEWFKQAFRKTCKQIHVSR